MAINKNQLYMILNENNHSVFFPTKDGGFMLDAARDGVAYTHQVYFDDIIFANSSSGLFRDGTLFFEEEFEEAIYNELRIADWKEIWHNSDIERILLDPRIEDIQRIINFKSRPVFDRVRGVFMGMLNAGEDVHPKARTAIEKRQEELERGIRVSRIGIVQKEVDTSAEVENLKKIVADLVSKVEEQAPAVIKVESEAAPVKKATAQKKTTKPRTSQTKAKAKPTES
jgi:hypothetical protein